MAPPLVKGRALVRRRLAGIVFLVVIALLVELSVAVYQKKFASTVEVALETDRIGNQLSVHADVKLRGIVVGEVRRISTHGDKATLQLALDPDAIDQIPVDVRAQLLPKTLFGEKQVALIIPDRASGTPLKAGDTISQDRSHAALETETALDDLLPVLRSLQPQKLSMALNALSSTLRGRGDRIGADAALQAAYLHKINPQLPTLARDMRGLADLAENYADTTPDLLRTLDNLSANSRSLVDEQASLDAFLRSTTDFAGRAQSFLAQNDRRFDDLARDSRPSLDLFAAYSPGYPCLLNRVAFSEIEAERVFGGAQPGLHITVEATQDNGGYRPGDEPKNRETRQFTCYGLGKTAIRPFPDYVNTQDGYRDDAPPEGSGGPGRSGATSWQHPFLDAPTVSVTTAALPPRTTPFEALLLAPIAGSGGLVRPLT